MPAPHWIAINPENGNYHLGYLLAAPVARTNAARLKPLRYLAAIEHVLAKKLGADMGYVGLITKNPVHGDGRENGQNRTLSMRPVRLRP